jgi:hypothetical protein
MSLHARRLNLRSERVRKMCWQCYPGAGRVRSKGDGDHSGLRAFDICGCLCAYALVFIPRHSLFPRIEHSTDMSGEPYRSPAFHKERMLRRRADVIMLERTCSHRISRESSTCTWSGYSCGFFHTGKPFSGSSGANADRAPRNCGASRCNADAQTSAPHQHVK